MFFLFLFFLRLLTSLEQLATDGLRLIMKFWLVTLLMKGVIVSETSVPMYETTWRSISKAVIMTCSCKKLKSHIF
jgi:hypothetical protein